MVNLKKRGRFGNKNAYKGEYNIDFIAVLGLRESHSWEKISNMLGVPRTTLMRKLKEYQESEKKKIKSDNKWATGYNKFLDQTVK